MFCEKNLTENQQKTLERALTLTKREFFALPDDDVSLITSALGSHTYDPSHQRKGTWITLDAVRSSRKHSERRKK